MTATAVRVKTKHVNAPRGFVQGIHAKIREYEKRAYETEQELGRLQDLKDTARYIGGNHDSLYFGCDLRREGWYEITDLDNMAKIAEDGWPCREGARPRFHSDPVYRMLYFAEEAYHRLSEEKQDGPDPRNMLGKFRDQIAERKIDKATYRALAEGTHPLSKSVKKIARCAGDDALNESIQQAREASKEFTPLKATAKESTGWRATEDGWVIRDI